jgi:hypothetical protein
MSRYEYPPGQWPDPMSFAIGWDPSLDTNFAQVTDHSVGGADGGVIVRMRALPPQYTDMDTQMQTLNHRILGRLHLLALTARTRAKLIAGPHLRPRHAFTELMEQCDFRQP